MVWDYVRVGLIRYLCSWDGSLVCWIRSWGRANKHNDNFRQSVDSVDWVSFIETHLLWILCCKSVLLLDKDIYNKDGSSDGAQA